MVDLKDGDKSGARVDILEVLNSVCVVNSSVTAACGKTATGCCIECFGFYCLLTNHHVIPSFEVAQKTLCYFGFVPGSTGFKLSLNPSLIYWSSPQDILDCTIVALSVQTNLPVFIRPFIPDQRPASVGDYVHVWGHPNMEGRPFQQSSGVIAKLLGSTVHYRANTLDGFSGSPVTSNQSGRLVALHCGGPTKSHPQAGNTGTSIHAIIDAFNREFNVFTIMSNSHAALAAAASLSPSPSTVDLLACQGHKTATLNNGGRGVVESLSSLHAAAIVPSYSLPIASNVTSASVATSRAIGYAVAPVLGSQPGNGIFSSSSSSIESNASWTEFATTTAVGLVPIVGPLCNSLFHAQKQQYVSALVDMLCAGVDLCTILCAVQNGNHNSESNNTRIILKESTSSVISDLCTKKLLVHARRLLVTGGEQTMKHLAHKSGESIVRNGAQHCILKSALVKTTTTALASATNAYDRGMVGDNSSFCDPSAIPEEVVGEDEEHSYFPFSSSNNSNSDGNSIMQSAEVWAQ